jgi:O-antigen ligase
MFEEKPIFGWGPGTYMFQYAPYQASYLKTSESSNLGLKGNAHSEYLGLLSEAGLPAALAFISIIVLLLYKGFHLISKLKPKSADRIILTGVLFGLITYVVHGILNNFLDMDKVAVLFWGYAAQILAMDYRYSKSNPNIEISSNTSESDSRS